MNKDEEQVTRNRCSIRPGTRQAHRAAQAAVASPGLGERAASAVQAVGPSSTIIAVKKTLTNAVIFTDVSLALLTCLTFTETVTTLATVKKPRVVSVNIVRH